MEDQQVIRMGQNDQSYEQLQKVKREKENPPKTIKTMISKKLLNQAKKASK